VTPVALPLQRFVSVLQAAGLVSEVIGSGDVSIHGVKQDSRQVQAGDLFVAWTGTAVDAHAFVPQACAQGAVAVIVERKIDHIAVPQIIVRDGRQAAALAADVLWGSPWQRLHLVGVTGTNGKTTTVALIRHLFAARGPAATLGTLGVTGPDGKLRPAAAALTTPGPVELAQRLAELADEGVKTVALEASSHALDQHRLDGVRFNAVVFTNLSQDHLDYHGTLEAYRAAKLRLVDLLASDGVAVVNAADSAWDGIATPSMVRFAVIGSEGTSPADDAGRAGTTPCDLQARVRSVSAHGSSFELLWQGRSALVDLPLPGQFNIENATAAAAVALAAGYGLDDVAARLASAPAVPGRLEVVVDAPFTVLIDFAHTPDALDRVLAMLRPLTQGRLVVVFGAGGDRDRTKREPMARAVGRWADRVWLTSDNPRSEDPDAILDDLAVGLSGSSVHRQVDRRRAIEGALAEAQPGDVVVLAGKGHERTQELAGRRLPFDEREIVGHAMAQLVGAR
jgi:UDP-N-acetylmuramoyl-L-alanyl-D-glutamate--2,6-diaminopimelate ligase